MASHGEGNHDVCGFNQIRRRRPTPATLQIYRQPGTGEDGGGGEGGGGGQMMERES